VVILDMEAGIEHLARGTARAVDQLIIVVEPGRRSIETALRIRDLARDLGLQNIAVVANKVDLTAVKQQATQVQQQAPPVPLPTLPPDPTPAPINPNIGITLQ